MTQAWQQFKDEIRYLTQPTWTLADVGDFFDSIAVEYDEINEGAHSYFRRFTDTLRLAELPDKARLLDVQARSGNGMTSFYQHGKVASGVCGDMSVEMGKICSARVRAAGLEDYRWFHVTDYHWPLDTAEFDITLCLETVEHVPQPGLWIQELARVTKPGGTLLLSTPNVLWEPVHALAAVTGLHHSEGPHRFIRYKRLVEMVETAGFSIRHAETTVLIPAGPEWLIEAGAWIEERTKQTLMPLLGLRRLLICRRLGET
jgi:2-polyprenyl-3-methyl-5-hydroxy-6-metoxy-1,4-benzoquinol methylase